MIEAITVVLVGTLGFLLGRLYRDIFPKDDSWRGRYCNAKYQSITWQQRFYLLCRAGDNLLSAIYAQPVLDPAGPLAKACSQLANHLRRAGFSSPNIEITESSGAHNSLVWGAVEGVVTTCADNAFYISQDPHVPVRCDCDREALASVNPGDRLLVFGRITAHSVEVEAIEPLRSRDNLPQASDIRGATVGGRVSPRRRD